MATTNPAIGNPVPNMAAENFFKREWDSGLMRSIRCLGWFAAGLATARFLLSDQRALKYGFRYALSNAAISATMDGIAMLAIVLQVSALGIAVLRSWLRLRHEKRI